MTPDCSITARSSAEIVAVAPYVIGFHPTDSIVVVGAVQGLITFGMRYDLPPPDDDVRDMARLVARQHLRQTWVLGYGPPARVTPAVLRLADSLTQAKVRVSDVIRVGDNRWWSYRCADIQCCPPEGRPVDTALSAAAVFQGYVALPDRQSLVARVAHVPDPKMTAATARARARLVGDRAMLRRSGRQAVRGAEAHFRGGGVPTADEVARLGVLLGEPGVLGYALDRTLRAGGEWRVGLWTEVLRRVEIDYVPAPACLLALAAWRVGDGALARVAIDRALTQDPRHPTAALLDSLLCSGLGPTALVALEPPSRRSG